VVVQLDRPEVALDPPPRLDHLEPVLRRLLARELGRFGNVAASPDHDRIAALNVLLEVRIRDLAGKEACAVLGLFRASLLCGPESNEPSAGSATSGGFTSAGGVTAASTCTGGSWRAPRACRS